MFGSREEFSGALLRVSVSIAVDQLGCHDMVGGIKKINAVVWHGRTGMGVGEV